MVPRSAAANSPGLACTALVKAPRTCPNSWLSSNASGIAPQLMGTNACACRGLAAWMALATISLPVPLSPVMRTLLGVELILATCARRLRMAALSPSRRCSGTAGSTVRPDALIKDLSDSAARSQTRFSVSEGKGMRTIVTEAAVRRTDWKSCFGPVLQAIVPTMQQALLLRILLTPALLALAGLLLRPAR